MNGDPFHASEVTPPSLIAGIREGNDAAWNRLVRLYSPWVYAHCRRQGVSESDAADILQETFRAVLRGFRSFRREKDGEKLRYWIRTVATNKVRDHFRKVRVGDVAFGGTSAQQQFEAVADAVSVSTDEPVSANLGLHEILRDVKSEFESHNWQAFWMTVVEQVPVAEVSQSLGMSSNAIRQARFRILRRLRDRLGKVDGGNLGNVMG